MQEVWNRADFNGNGGCSLAELDKLAVEKGWSLSKPALMRAYKKTTLQDGDGDPWVEKKEFPAFIANAILFERLWGVFDDLDADDDRRIDLPEFRSGLAKLGCEMTEEEAATEFAKIDTNDGGKVLFRELCAFVARTVGVSLEAADAEWEEGSKSRQ